MNATVVSFSSDNDTPKQIWKKRNELRSYLIVGLVVHCFSDFASAISGEPNYNFAFQVGVVLKFTDQLQPYL